MFQDFLLGFLGDLVSVTDQNVIGEPAVVVYGFTGTSPCASADR